jgi:MFS family permease
MTVTSQVPGSRPGPGRLATAWRSGPLGLPGFRLLTFGQLASTVGDSCYAVALPWLVLSGGGSAASLGIVLACYGIPRAALTVPGGALADRFGPRLMMLSSDAARCALAAVFVVLAAEHVSALAVVAPVAALLGAFSALFSPASMAMMPSLLDSSRLTSANAVYTSVVQAGSVLGPVLGGILVATTGPAAAFGVDAGSYLVSAVTLAFIAGTRHVAATATASMEGMLSGAGVDGTAPDTSVLNETVLTETGLNDTVLNDTGPGGTVRDQNAPGSVWALLRQSRLLQTILVVSLIANFALTGTGEVALPALTHDRFGADGYGAVLTCVAVATIIGALAVSRVGDRIRPAWLIAGAFVVAAAAIAAAPYIGGLAGLAAGMAVFGVAIGFDSVVSVTVIQRWAPPAMLGRVVGLLLLASAGSFPVSTFVAGVLTRHLGPAPVFLVTGGLLALAMLYGLTQREFRAFGTEPGQPELA